MATFNSDVLTAPAADRVYACVNFDFLPKPLSSTGL